MKTSRQTPDVGAGTTIQIAKDEMHKEVQTVHSLPHAIFIYGTLKREQPNHHLLQNFGNHQFFGRGHTELKYPLIIDSKYANLPFLLDAPGKGQIVYGEIYYVDDKFMGYLDDFEGCPHLYQRDVITVSTQSQSQHEGSMTESSSPVQKTLKCNTYMRKHFDQALLEEETLSSYDSLGSHGQFYTPELDDF